LTTDFGNKPPKQAPKERVTKTAVQVGRQPHQPQRKEVYIVDETVERSIMAVYTTITYKPNEILDSVRDKRKIELANENGIRLRKRE
jgi:hypothetical protein